MENGNVIVVGAGIWGCTVARRAAEAGCSVRVLERRPVVGGNARCETDKETGIEVHAYGSHIFHTHDRKVWNFIRRFSDFNGYQHKVLANYRGKIYHLPIGLTLVNKFFGLELKPKELDAFMQDPSHSAAVFDAFFRGYTSKQWGCQPEQIDSSIIKRVPVRDNYDTNYFKDYWQGIPCDGYNALFQRMLDHPNIDVQCNTKFSLEQLQDLKDRRVYYSGPIDELFGFRFGALPWRSLRFELQHLDMVDFQGTSVVNYTEADIPYTRIHEFKHYHPELTDIMSLAKTVIMREYPQPWQLGIEPYYPILTAESKRLLSAYYEASAQYDNLVVGGRLGSFKYFDMDQAMKAAMELVL